MNWHERASEIEKQLIENAYNYTWKRDQLLKSGSKKKPILSDNISLEDVYEDNKLRSKLVYFDSVLESLGIGESKLTQKLINTYVSNEIEKEYTDLGDQNFKYTFTNTTESYKLKGYKIINSNSSLRQLRNKMTNLDAFAFDTETNTLKVLADNKDFRCVGISISWGEFDNYYIPLNHKWDKNVKLSSLKKYLKDIFESITTTIVGHNIKFDMHVLARLGIKIVSPNIFDTMCASWIVDENTPNGLKENTEMNLGVPQTHFNEVTSLVPKLITKKYCGGKKATFDLTRVRDSAPYALDDAYYTWSNYVYYLDKLDEEKMSKIYYKTYPAFIHTLFSMEEIGMRVDIPKLNKMGEEMQKDLDRDLYNMLEMAGVQFNPGSSQQLQELLFGYADNKNPNNDILEMSFGFPYSGDKPSTGAEELEKILRIEYKSKRKKEGQELVKALLEYKKLGKLKTAFVDGLLDQLYDDGRAHPSFNPIGTDSGRISCSKPNLMQLPNAEDDDKYQIRDCFIGDYNEELGEDEDIISIDYSNLEVRVMAHWSKDPGLLKAFAEGKDLHGNTAKLMFRLDCDANDVKKLYKNLRQQGKVIAFLLQYGGSSATLYQDLNKKGELDAIFEEVKSYESQGKKLPPHLVDYKGCTDCKPKKGMPGLPIAQRLMDMYFQAFPGIADFMKSQKKFAHRNEYVNTLVGRKRRLPFINGDFREEGYAERLSINACIQGSAADIMINAQNKIAGNRPSKLSHEYMDKHPELDRDNMYNWNGAKRLKDLGCKMLVQIHDELLFSCPKNNCEEAMDIIKDFMCNPFGEKVKLNLKLDVGMGHSKSYQGGH